MVEVALLGDGGKYRYDEPLLEQDGYEAVWTVCWPQKSRLDSRTTGNRSGTAILLVYNIKKYSWRPVLFRFTFFCAASFQARPILHFPLP